MIKINYFKLISSIIICQLAGIIGSIFTLSSVSSWYLTLNKPVFNPPSWLFGPVWTLLYLLMGISLYLVWNKDKKPKSKNYKIGILFFLIQLVLNSIWSILFFGAKSPSLAFIEIIILWFSILFTIFYFYRISRASAYLLLPYLIWVSFASILNYYIMILN